MKKLEKEVLIKMYYFNYISRNFKSSWFSDNVQFKHNKSNVGCIPHIQNLNTVSNIKKRRMFNKWYNRPKKAHQLYWKLHSQEYPFQH